MEITLDPRDQKDLEALARANGRAPEQLLRELLHEAIADRKRNGSGPADEAGEATRQQRAWDDLTVELDALPVSEKAKGFSGRDHDEVLYGWKK
ncbi:MAG: hypothetical protein HY721_34830 [Planctomycetes bacterium]|nr:hypothetical protein [Planctomycetota bacterium]